MSNGLFPKKDAMEFVLYCFNQENNNFRSRKDFIDDFLEYLTLTDDGSYTLFSDNFNDEKETMHTMSGAISESFEKFIKPLIFDKKDIRVLDVCSGFGYNSAALINHLNIENSTEYNLNIDMVEFSLETLAATLLIPDPISSYGIIKKVTENKLLELGYINQELEESKIPESLKIDIYQEDIRQLVTRLKENIYDFIFLDPFSPLRSPELFTIDLFKELKRILKENGMIVTYTSAAPVRSALIELGFHTGMGPIFGRKTGGTIASPDLDKIKTTLSKNDELMIGLSDLGTPLRDPSLHWSSEEVLDYRRNERSDIRNVKVLASTVKTPIFLARPIVYDNIGRRVIGNLKKLGISDTLSDDALFIACPVYDECICGCGESYLLNSRDRVRLLKSRLNSIIK